MNQCSANVNILRWMAGEFPVNVQTTLEIFESSASLQSLNDGLISRYFTSLNFGEQSQCLRKMAPLIQAFHFDLHIDIRRNCRWTWEIEQSLWNSTKQSSGEIPHLEKAFDVFSPTNPIKVSSTAEQNNYRTRRDEKNPDKSDLLYCWSVWRVVDVITHHPMLCSRKAFVDVDQWFLSRCVTTKRMVNSIE